MRLTEENNGEVSGEKVGEAPVALNEDTVSVG